MTIETFQKDRVVMTAKQITKIFPGTRALQEVDFTVYGGKINVLVGENGAGKSTLMKILTGVYVKDSGTCKVNGKEVVIHNYNEARREGISLIFQENLLQQLLLQQEYPKLHKFHQY